MAIYELRIDGVVMMSGEEEDVQEAYQEAISGSEFEAKVEMCKVIIVESVERGLVVKKRRGRKKK